MSRHKKPASPTKTPVYRFGLNAETGEAEARKLNVVQEQDAGQNRFTLLSGSIPQEMLEQAAREREQDRGSPDPDSPPPLRLTGE